MLPVIFPRTTTDCALMFPVTIAESPRFRDAVGVDFPVQLPSKVSSPENLRFPLLISTSEPNTIF